MAEWIIHSVSPLDELPLPKNHSRNPHNRLPIESFDSGLPHITMAEGMRRRAIMGRTSKGNRRTMAEKIILILLKLSATELFDPVQGKRKARLSPKSSDREFRTVARMKPCGNGQSQIHLCFSRYGVGSNGVNTMTKREQRRYASIAKLFGDSYVERVLLQRKAKPRRRLPAGFHGHY